MWLRSSKRNSRNDDLQSDIRQSCSMEWCCQHFYPGLLGTPRSRVGGFTTLDRARHERFRAVGVGTEEARSADQSLHKRQGVLPRGADVGSARGGESGESSGPICVRAAPRPLLDIHRTERRHERALHRSASPDRIRPGGCLKSRGTDGSVGRARHRRRADGNRARHRLRVVDTEQETERPSPSALRHPALRKRRSRVSRRERV
jgi:hypothetical protein